MCKKDDERSIWDAAWADALRATSLGWDLALPICGGAVVGHLLDRHFETGYVMTAGLLFLGVLVGLYNAGRRIHDEIERDRQRTDLEHRKDTTSWRDSAGSS